jgi:thymidylate synthase (FAD)
MELSQYRENKDGSMRKNSAKYPIKELYQKWNNNKDWFLNRRIRVVDEETHLLKDALIDDIFKRDVQPVYSLEVEGNYKLECTRNHRIFTNQGWKTLDEFARLSETGIIAFQKDIQIATNGTLESAGNEIYKKRDWLSEQVEKGLSGRQIGELVPCSESTINRWMRHYKVKSQYKRELPGNGIYKNKEWLTEQTAKGLSYEQISKLVPCTEHTIHKWMCRYKLKSCHKWPIWNKGLKYKTGPNKNLSEESRQKRREARTGPRCNFWKGGITPDRKNIGRWTIEQGPKIREKFDYTCQICEKRGGTLVSHHLIPVWYDKSKARDFDNLVCVHDSCHKNLHAKNEELEFAKNYKGIILDKNKVKPQREFRHICKFRRIVNIAYVGKKQCYDIAVKGKNNNFIAGGIVVHNSLRYRPVTEYYYPEVWRKQSEDNKQGSAGPLGESEAKEADYTFRTTMEVIITAYENLLAHGVAKEQARILLPLNLYTEVAWMCSAQALYHFIQLRDAPDSQWEIREYARVMREMLKEKCPFLYGIWFDE